MLFINYFWDGRKFNLFKKLFGFSKETNNRVTAGIFPMLKIIFYENKAHIIHIINLANFSLPILIFSYFRSMQIIYSVHGFAKSEIVKFRKSIGFRETKTIFAEKIILKKSNLLIFHSEWSKHYFESNFKIIKDKVVIPHGIEKVLKPKIKNKARKQIKVVFDGADRPEKGIEYLSKVIEKSGAQFSFDLYCMGNNTNFARSFFINLSEKRVRILKRVPRDIFLQNLKESDVFLSLSEYENFGMSTLEAMANGLIAVTSENCGVSEYFDEDMKKFIVDPKNIENVLDLLNEISEFGEEKRDFYIQKNIEFANKFSLEGHFEKIALIYERGN